MSPSHPVTYLLEIGTEELPATDLQSAIEQLKRAVPKLFGDLRLSHGEIFVSGTPRRLVVLAQGLAPRQADEETAVKGPPADRAFDASGAATPAAVGFARKNGVPVEALEIARRKGHGQETGPSRSMSMPWCGRPAGQRPKCWLRPCPVWSPESSSARPCAGITRTSRSRGPSAGWFHSWTPPWFRSSMPA